MIVSPGTARVSGVIERPTTLAQQVTVLVAVKTTSTPPVLVEAVLVLVAMLIPLPAGPGTFARSRIRVNAGAAEATTRASGSALMRLMRPSRMLASVSLVTTV